MKVMIPVDEDKSTVCAAFGRAPYFMICNTDDDVIEYKNNPAVSAHGGAGIKAAQFIIDCEADALITVRLGENAAEVLKAADIKIYKSIVASAQLNVENLKNEQLPQLTQFHAGYHGKL